MKIYVLMCYDDNEMNDIPWKYFVDEKLANYWRDEYNKQARAEFDFEDCVSDDEMNVHYYVEEQETEETENVDSLYGREDVEPVQIDVTFGINIIDELFLSRGLC